MLYVPMVLKMHDVTLQFACVKYRYYTSIQQWFVGGTSMSIHIVQIEGANV
jgi:hypothetical protein